MNYKNTSSVFINFINTNKESLSIPLTEHYFKSFSQRTTDNSSSCKKVTKDHCEEELSFVIDCSSIYKFFGLNIFSHHLCYTVRHILFVSTRWLIIRELIFTLA